VYFAAKRTLDRARERIATIAQKQHLMQHDLDALDRLLAEVDQADTVLRAVEDRLRRRPSRDEKL
jgi:hypothetical protein